QQPTDAHAGQTIAPAVTVQVLDQFGNVVTTDSSSITVGLAVNPGSGTLGGATTVQAVGGVATFSDLSINKVGVGYRLSALGGGLPGATTTTFNITPAAADHLAFMQQPTNTTAGVVITPAVTVRVL